MPKPLRRPASVESPAISPSDSPTIVGTSLSQVLPGDYSEAGQHVLVSGHLLSQRYEVLSLLGEGGMGAVYKAGMLSSAAWSP